jgi:hypothetical protein
MKRLRDGAQGKSAPSFAQKEEWLSSRDRSGPIDKPLLWGDERQRQTLSVRRVAAMVP